MRLSYIEERKKICQLVKDMFDRMMTNAAGGNVSLRVDDNKVLLTPAKMAENDRCRLEPEDLLLVDLEMNVLEGTRSLTREANMHLGILKEFPAVNACIHAHPRNIMTFVAFELPMPSVTEATAKFGNIECLPYHPATTKELADAVVEYFKTKKNVLEKHACAVMLARHGIIIAGKSLEEAYNALERIETNAYIVLNSKLLVDNPVLKVAKLQEKFQPSTFVAENKVIYE
ncbi:MULTISPECIES: class II aldolase/adducin family protein [Thermoanaerobacter]|uniref:Class II aldolase/adducin family protein n=2 Tax=Thermoanaerobacter TaxID=1754 RepID=D3T774_THEIA|nr:MULTISPECIES: class II aldolase/adducin family protein [Thermoanaerobacter]ADD01806.1 class II aldolase/adducin family protein [Thermoanaerobacter italicus Ab9]MDP9750570.1 L-fuculose-phosphate aldolase [Thermoanaerobacter pentosaceus]